MSKMTSEMAHALTLKVPLPEGYCWDVTLNSVGIRDECAKDGHRWWHYWWSIGDGYRDDIAGPIYCEEDSDSREKKIAFFALDDGEAALQFMVNKLMFGVYE